MSFLKGVDLGCISLVLAASWNQKASHLAVGVHVSKLTFDIVPSYFAGLPCFCGVAGADIELDAERLFGGIVDCPDA